MKIILAIQIEEKHSGGANAVAQSILRFLFAELLLDLVTTSCGCYQRENNHKIVTHKRVYKKGLSKTYPELLKYWERLMKYKRSLLCDRWSDEENGVYNFIEDMKDTHFKRARIHRKDPNRPYSKENCFWDTRNYIVDLPPERKEL